MKADEVDHFLCLHVQLFEVAYAFLCQLILGDKQVIIAVISKNKFGKWDARAALLLPVGGVDRASHSLRLQLALLALQPQLQGLFLDPALEHQLALRQRIGFMLGEGDGSAVAYDFSEGSEGAGLVKHAF